MNIKAIWRFCGVDAAIRPLLFGRAWSVLAGPLTPIAVGTMLSKQEQGIFYAFGSLLALQSTLELGFGQVFQQFVAHERGDHVGGDKLYSRLRCLLLAAFGWYSFLTLAVLIGIGPVGAKLLSANSGGVNGWRFGWWLLVGATVPSILFQPVATFLYALGEVPAINKARAFGVIGQGCSLWAVLFCGGGLLAPAIASILSTVISAAPVLYAQRKLLAKVLKSKPTDDRRDLLRELISIQLRTALTWFTGYFVFQIFSPLLLHYGTTAELGAFGMSLAILSSAASFPMAWIETKLPGIASSLAAGDGAAEEMFRSSFLRVLLFSTASLGAAVIGMNILDRWVFSSPRLLPSLGALALACGLLLQNISTSFVSFVRAHKQEPFVMMAWGQAFLTTCSAWILIQTNGAMGACVAYFLSWLIILPWSFVIFSRFWVGVTKVRFTPMEVFSLARQFTKPVLKNG